MEVIYSCVNTTDQEYFDVAVNKEYDLFWSR